MTGPTGVADAIIEEVKHWLAENPPSGRFLATYSDAEVVDADLSIVSLPDGSVLRGVPRLEHVTGLTLGDVILCDNADGTLPVIIVGKIVGDISSFGG